jgi:hypothetical protein
MNMDGAAHIPAGVNGLEFGYARFIGELNPAQEARVGGFRRFGGIGVGTRIVAGDAGIVSARVAVPDIDRRVGEWGARVGVVDRDL